MENKIFQLINKAKIVLNPQIVHFDDIRSISSELQVILPTIFIEFSGKCNHEYSSRFDWAGFPDGIIKRTIKLREQGLPHQYIILANQGDAGSIFLETQDSPEKPSPVIWCDMEDVYNLCEDGVFRYNPTIWPSFTDFFEYLVEQEEKAPNESN